MVSSLPPAVVDVISSRHPHQPGDSHVVVGEVGSTVVVVVVVVLSLHPNQPGVSQVDVELVSDVVVVVMEPSPVVVLSRHPHQPGVSQVDVRVRVLDVTVGEGDVVVDSVPLLSYIFHCPQSRHSGVNEHSGTSSYLRMTSLMTDRILWVPMPTRHPLSATTS